MKIGILTSGGDAPGMNAAIRAVVKIAERYNIETVGIEDGYLGLCAEKFVPLNSSLVSGISSKGGTILGSARYREFKKDEVVDFAVGILQKHNIDALVVIGGDGSYRGARALTAKGINCIGIPGTIDNDIPGTEQTIGFDTALNTSIEAIDKLRDTSASHHRCSVIQLMGNHCGDLSLFAAMSCGAEIVITPETGYDEELVINKIKSLEKKKRHCIVVVTEKILDVEDLATKISQHTSFAARATVLGYVQRGGSPTARDRVLAVQMGEMAVHCLVEGKGGLCVGIKDNKIISTPIEEALDTPKHSRKKEYERFSFTNIPE